MPIKLMFKIDGDFVERATVDARSFVVSRAVWNTAEPNQHGTAMLWEMTAERYIVLSRVGTLQIDRDRYRFVGFNLDTAELFLESIEPVEMPHDAPLFPLGTVTGTPLALAAIEASGEAPETFVARHVSGDWGNIIPSDADANRAAIKSGDRILSAYVTAKGVELWCITEGNFTTTTLLLPEEY